MQLFCCPVGTTSSFCTLAGGCIPASKSSLHKTLKAGHSALVLVGGIAEMFMLEWDREIIMLQKRRGFVRAALEAGVPILPVYYFGQSKVLSFGPKYVLLEHPLSVLPSAFWLLVALLHVAVLHPQMQTHL